MVKIHHHSRKRSLPKSWRLLLGISAFIIIIAFQKQLFKDRRFSLTSSTAQNNNVLFTCPDGRLGLHIVHTRFLIGQAKSNAVFVASRLLLLRSFLIPNLNAQTTQSFVTYVAHDPDLSPAIVDALHATLAATKQRVLVATETNTTMPTLNMPNIFKSISKWDPRITSSVSLLITSRIDLDDLAHTNAAAAVQAASCETPPPKKRGVAIKLAYMNKGMLWYPSAQDPYGQTCEWTNYFKSHLAIMQSMALAASPGKSGRSMLKSCNLNVYSYPHYKPQEIEQLKPHGCGKIQFNATTDVFRWKPEKNDITNGGGRGDNSTGSDITNEKGIGCLYSKTASSWSFGKLHHKGIVCTPADPERLEKLFAASRQRVAAVNALFAGLEKEAPKLVINSTKEHLE
jgi:hypothetical protein